MKVLHGIKELELAIGTHIGYSEWHTVTQHQVDTFAEATGDHQWIHVDQEKAAAGPFGTTIAHGYLTLSLVPMLVLEVFQLDGVRMGVNYGANKLRFPVPVPVGSRVRAGVELLSLTPGPRGHQLTARVSVQCEGSDKPACVVETLSILVP